jgi:hypothetical protein
MHAVVMDLPLSTRLSHALVAFTIEADHVFELEMPHTTTEDLKAGRPARGPWLISLAFWSNCLNHVAADGSPVGEVLDRGFLADNFLLGTNPGMVRWGYLSLVPASQPSKRPNRTWTVAPTAAGRQAQTTWAPIPAAVEGRWVDRWPGVLDLRKSLEVVVEDASRDLPDHLPVNGWGGRADVASRPAETPANRHDLGALLAKALLLFTIEVETASPVALVHSANVLRALRDGPVGNKELPAATGVAKETLKVLTGQLHKHGLIAPSPEKTFGLTDSGRKAAADATAAVAAVEARWPTDLRTQLEPLTGDGTVDGSALAEAIRPPEGTWRSRRPMPQTLPHHPVVSHRGGYPDGS